MKRKCLIIGANGGIGHAIMSRMLKEHYEVIGTYHSSEGYLKLYENNKNMEIRCLELKKLDKKGLLDINLEGITDVVFAAGKESLKNIINCTRDEMIEQYDINVFSPMLILQVLLQKHSERLQNIVFISSSAAVELKSSNGVYALSKACLCNLVKMLDGELKTKGVRVNCIVPGWCETKMAERISVAKGSSMELIKSGKLENRLVQVEEIAEICMFLLSDLAKNIHGQFIGVDVPEKEL